MSAPPGPWTLSGECLVGVVRPGSAAALPTGFHGLPGPRMIVGARYDQSPVGPYLELAVCEPARVGGRIGMCVTTMVVNSVEARRGGRSNWGMPKELGALDWSTDGDTRVLHWAERDLTLRATPIGPPLPALVPFRTIQGGLDGPLAAAAKLRGRGRLARVEADVDADDPLAWASGGHVGVIVSSARLVMGEACPTPGLRAALNRTRSAAEPALAWAPNQGD
ncbi:MAG TPA: acetoacetate decarboxylase family protein [Acidimicrobiales bacterium]|nr:acetoacetate decarboxylase family protein [Acidimicrobiales bacterium]